MNSGSSVSNVTVYRLLDWGTVTSRDIVFLFTVSWPALWPMHAPIQWMLKLSFVRIVHLEYETDHSHICQLPKSKNALKLYLYIPNMCSWQSPKILCDLINFSKRLLFFFQWKNPLWELSMIWIIKIASGLGPSHHL